MKACVASALYTLYIHVRVLSKTINLKLFGVNAFDRSYYNSVLATPFVRKQPSKPTTRAASKSQSPGPVAPTSHQKLAGKKQPPTNVKATKPPLLAQ